MNNVITCCSLTYEYNDPEITGSSGAPRRGSSGCTQGPGWKKGKAKRGNHRGALSVKWKRIFMPVPILSGRWNEGLWSVQYLKVKRFNCVKKIEWPWSHVGGMELEIRIVSISIATFGADRLSTFLLNCRYMKTSSKLPCWNLSRWFLRTLPNPIS